MRRASGPLLAGTANPENLRQIFQVRLLLEAEGKLTEEYEMPLGLLDRAQQVRSHHSREPNCPAGLSPRFPDVGWKEQVWKEQVLNFMISKLHKDVSAVLEALGVPHQNEFMTEDCLFSIDIALSGQQVALEVDGPFHFTHNTRAPLGEVLLISRV